MRVKFIICMIGCISGASSYAQSSLTLYGEVDANIGAVTNTVGGTQVQEQSGAFQSDRWGIRGVEDLGGGTKAVMVLESSFLLQNGELSTAGTLWGKQSYVGIQSDTYGNLTLGRQYSPLGIMAAYFTPTYYSNQYSPTYAATGPNLYENNSIKYTFKRGGFEAQALYNFGDVAGSLRQNSAYGAGVTYNFGKIAALIAYDQTNTATMFDYAPDRRIALALRGYAGNVKLEGGYRYGNGETYLAPVFQYYHRDDLFWLGVSYYITPSNEIVTEYWLDVIKSYGVNSASHTSLPTTQQLDFQFMHFLSKSTDLYVVGAYARQAAVDFDNLYSGSVSALQPGRHDQVAFAVGVHHRF